MAFMVLHEKFEDITRKGGPRGEQGVELVGNLTNILDKLLLVPIAVMLTEA